MSSYQIKDNGKDTHKMAFRGKLPDEILDQEKEPFQKGTNFKEYIEQIILEDKDINFKNRKKIFHVICDNFEKINGFSHKKLREKVQNNNVGIYKWV